MRHEATSAIAESCSNAATETILPPSTRYQGSKRRLLGWIHSCIRDLEFDTALDAFAGTASVSYVLKSLGRSVIANDVLESNAMIATALIENDRYRLSASAIDRIAHLPDESAHPTFISDTFKGIYFTDAENRWLDAARAVISRLPNRRARAIAWYAMFQAAIAKRPYNLFHRRNLYMRTANVARSFGNKRTWDRSFGELFTRFARQANHALIESGGTCRAIRGDVLDAPTDVDLVYIDPPYCSSRGISVDYAHFYHFLEGLMDYENWPARIDWDSRHRRLKPTPSPWTDPRQIAGAFETVFRRFADSILVVSYRSDGIPTIDELATMLRKIKRSVRILEQKRQYVLSTNRRSHEILLIAK